MTDHKKIAIRGYGHIEKKHAEIAAQMEGCELIALIDPKFATESVPGLQEVAPFYSLEDFLQSGLAADIVAICMPNGLHFAQAKMLIEMGIHVIIENPITLRSEEASVLIRLAAENNVHVCTAMQNCFSPPAVWLKSILDAGVLGRIYMVQISCFWNHNEHYYAKESWRGTKDLDGVTLYTQFSHYLDLMYLLFGDIPNIRSKFADFNRLHLTEFEDSGIITFGFEPGGMGSFTFSTSVWNENLESSLTVIAENGSVKIGGKYINIVEKCNIKDYEASELAEAGVANGYGAFKGSAQNHHHLYQNVIEFLQHGKEIHPLLLTAFRY